MVRLFLTLITPLWAQGRWFRDPEPGLFLPESWELTLRCLEASHMLSSFGLKCFKSTYYGPQAGALKVRCLAVSQRFPE